ncbi:MAG: YiiX family permuted papain-like enzyme [Flavobacterium sp.]|uniref:YiiX family permuted papain-like enzyme n=1 Tax=Flavobacterium sp. TaxID=239 RepID=UPI0012002F19|nr:YiiX family permuted papain-like enzyme [Flavobacterium sp.]RZJ67619.1 MAG: YiiX family permuted papain-like enzyme [Flavobacterium sp.]
MRKVTLLVIFLILSAGAGLIYCKKFYNRRHEREIANEEGKAIPNQYKNGDIIFQTSTSSQSRAIQLATHSKYSHCGIIYNENGTYVFEAVQPVKMTPLSEWIARGKNGKYVVKRLKDRDRYFTRENISKVASFGKAMVGKSYDLGFSWSDEKIYCSELVWKMYKRAFGVKVGKLEKLKDFDLSQPAVKAKLTERYGKNIPLDEIVISPQSIFESELLEDVMAN